MSEQSDLVIDQQGYFSHNGQRFVPAGVNYWPGSCGVEMWPRWPEAEIQHDLDVIKALGLNSIRFFLRWQDFEPAPGEYDAAMFGRLAQFLVWCREREVWAQPSLFVGWMSGGTFWPDWKGERNFFADPWMVERSTAFARRAAETIAPFHVRLLGIDQGNELCCLSDSTAAPPGQVIAWCAAINEAIRSVYPQALIISGNEQNQIVNDAGWRFDAQPGTDLYSMHGYPVPSWHSVGFDGMTDPLCQSLLPFYTQIARAFGPVMVQEFGTIVTFGQRQQDAYLKAVLPACWEAGANGFLWWCLRDIRADVHPYLSHRFESTLGLVDDEDRVKPGLAYFLEFARSIQERPAPSIEADTVGIYWPKHYYHRDTPLNPGNQPHRLSRWLVMTNWALRQLGYRTRIVRGDQPLSANLKKLLISGAMLDALEVQAVETWVRGGGNLIWHGPDPINWGHEMVRLLGAWPVDYRSVRPVQVDAFGLTWVLDTYPRDIRIELRTGAATIMARDGDRLPVLLRNDYGRGCVTFALPLVEEMVAQVADDPERRSRWLKWYDGLLAGGSL
ncbi:MAG: cellulase family glycosylhydrolase [Anaerolineae bacterium]|nr:cellulase family glycosylhydrolase [Anaerolineae bacterium]